MSDVVEINRSEELEPYRAAWNDLLAQTPHASFFHSLDWLLAYWRHFGATQKLRVLIVHDQGEPIGILPLVVCPEATRIGAVHVLTYPLHDWGSFFGPLGANSTATLLLGLKHIAATRRDWEMLDLRFVDKMGVDHARTATAMRTAGFGSWESPWKTTAVVEIDNTWNDYFQSRPKKFRHNVQRLERRAAEVGKLTVQRIRPRGSAHGDDDPHWSEFEEVMAVAHRSWQGESKDGTTLSHPSIEPFIRETHLLAAKNGMLDLSLLRMDGQLAAFAYNYVCRGRVYGLRTGYDPAFTKLGLGTILYLNTLKNSFERHDTFYDLGSGSLDVKRHWLTHLHSSYRYTHYPLLAPRAGFLALKRWWSERKTPTLPSAAAEHADSQPSLSS